MVFDVLMEDLNHDIRASPLWLSFGTPDWVERKALRHTKGVTRALWQLPIILTQARVDYTPLITFSCLKYPVTGLSHADAIMCCDLGDLRRVRRVRRVRR